MQATAELRFDGRPESFVAHGENRGQSRVKKNRGRKQGQSRVSKSLALAFWGDQFFRVLVRGRTGLRWLLEIGRSPLDVDVACGC